VRKDSISTFVEVLYRERVFILLLAVALLVMAGALGFSLTERHHGPWYARFGLGVWWAIVTLTTVGYGDVVPHTALGRLVGVGVMLGGVLALSLVTATVASVFIARKFRLERGLEPLKTTKHILILGWHYEAEDFLTQLLRRLPADMPVVLVNQLPPEQLENLKGKYAGQDLNYVWGDYSREEVLQKANVAEASRAIILADRPAGETAAQVDQRTLLTALTLKSLNPKIRVLAELLGPENRAYLERAGAEEVLIRGQYDSSLMAGAIAAPGLFRVFTGLLAGDGQNLWAVEVHSRFHGRPLKDLADFLRERHRALLIAIYTEARAVSLDDLLGTEPSAIDGFIRRKFSETGMTHLFGRTKVEYQINPPDNQILAPNQFVVVIAPQRPSM
jgi:voltage-gated potassium channel